MSNEGIQDDQVGEALLIRVVQDQIERENAIKEENIALPRLPEVQPLTNESNQKLVKQLAQTVKVIGDQLYQERRFNQLIDGLARQVDKKIFSLLVQGVFNDGQINWGRIVVLYYAVGRLAAKMVLAQNLSVFSEILDSCLDFFRTKLLVWIRNMGGWINSISALTQYALEHISSSSFFTIPSAELVLVFFCGIVLGVAIVWKFNRSS